MSVEVSSTDEEDKEGNLSKKSTKLSFEVDTRRGRTRLRTTPCKDSNKRENKKKETFFLIKKKPCVEFE